MWPSILAENACKGIGKLGELLLGRFYRNKEYLDELMKAKTKRDAALIESGEMIFNGTELVPRIPDPSLSYKSLPLMIGLEEECANLNDSLNIAADILKNIPEDTISDENVSKDWFTRWRKEAQLINNIEMKHIWGRILAEEIKQPDSISLVTLDRLKNITAKHAHLFCNIVRFRINAIIPINEKFDNLYNLNDLLELQNVGLVSVEPNIHPITLNFSPNIHAFMCNGFSLYFDVSEKIALNGLYGCIISTTGNEIINISDNITSATLEEIDLIGDYVWDKIPKKNVIKEMKACPILQDSDRNQYKTGIAVGTTLQSWPRLHR